MQFDAPAFVATDVCAAAAVVDVWLIRDDLAAPSCDALTIHLDQAELERAARFRQPRDRSTYLLAHAALRYLLAKRVEARPAELRFGRGRHGKPFLMRNAGWADLRFNMSRTRDWVAIAIALGVEVGVDVEAIEIPSSLDIAQQFFCEGELESLKALPASARARAFLNGWTRKEAFVKATGEGLIRPLHSFAVSLQSDMPVELLRCDGCSDISARWTLREVAVASEVAAAVAVAAPDARISSYRVDGGRVAEWCELAAEPESFGVIGF